MGEMIVACFIGAWLTTAGIIAYNRLKKDYETIDNNNEKNMEGTKR